MKERGKPLIVICGCHDASAVHRLKKETSHLFVLSVRRASSLHFTTFVVVVVRAVRAVYSVVMLVVVTLDVTVIVTVDV